MLKGGSIKMEPKNGFEWFVSAIKKYATFSGRARRKEFWYFMLFYVGGSIILSAIGNAMNMYLLQVLFAWALFLPSLAVCVRRMHDTNRSGWWILLPIVNLIFYLQDTVPGDNRFDASPKSFSGNADVIRPASGGMDNLTQIARLAELRDKGAITDKEFQAKKADLL